MAKQTASKSQIKRATALPRVTGARTVHRSPRRSETGHEALNAARRRDAAQLRASIALNRRIDQLSRELARAVRRSDVRMSQLMQDQATRARLRIVSPDFFDEQQQELAALRRELATTTRELEEYRAERSERETAAADAANPEALRLGLAETPAGV